MRGAIRKSLATLTRVTPLSNALRSISTRGLLPSGLWQRLPVERSFHVDLPGTAGFEYASNRRDGVGRELFWCGPQSEGTTLQIFQSECKRASVIVDIGANSGLFTLVACATNPTATVISVEPSPAVRAQLEGHINANGFSNRCVVRREAVADKNGTARFHVPDESWTSASLNEAGYLGLPGHLIEVQTLMLDEIAGSYPTIDLVKVDVEGFEDKVLAGMTETFKRSAPVVILECNFGGPSAEINAIMSKQDYLCFHLADRLTPVPEIRPTRNSKYRNYVYYPKSRHLPV